MNKFPATASIQPDHEYLAAVDVLRQHRIDCCAEGTCYTPPWAKIQNEVGIAGNAVRPLLRAEARSSQIHREDSKTPWLDMLAVCAFRKNNNPYLTLVLGASSPSVISQVVRKLDQGTTTKPGETSEKARLVSQAALLLKKFETKCKSGNESREALNTRVLSNLEQLVTSLKIQEDPKSKKFETNVISEWNSNLLMVCTESSRNEVLKLGLPGIELLSVPSMSDFVLKILPGWRAILGTGWLPGIDGFVSSLKAAIRTKDDLDYVQAELSSAPRSKPAEQVATASAKLTTFGWLPQYYSSHAVMRSKVAVGKFAKTTGGAMTDGDISVFPLPRVIVPGEEELRIGTPEERLESSWMRFQTSFPQDEFYMFCSHGAYGERKDEQYLDDESEAELRHLMPLGLFHPSALGVIQCLFPALPINVIGYNAAASTTTRSAVLDRLLRLVAAAPGDPVALGMLKDEVSRLSKRELPGMPKKSPHLRCIELDAMIQGASSAASARSARCENVFPESWPGHLLDRLLAAGRNRSFAGKDPFSLGIRMASLLLRVDHGRLRSMLLDNEGTPRKELQIARALHAMIRTAASGDPDVLRSQGSRFGHLGLRREIASMMREAANGRLASPPLLAEWMTKHVRITCIMPLDPLNEMDPAYRLEQHRHVSPCSFQSHRAYGALFGPDAQGESLEVNLAPLLELAFRALSPGGNKACGWLANKISQTNELSAAMMVRTGHLEDFPYGDFFSQKTARNIRSMLAAFPSRILLRCILADKSGRELLERWCGDLSSRVASHWKSDIKGHDKESAGLSSRAGTLLEIFGDREGMAAAALDCCRSKLSAAGDAKAPLTVNFFPDELANCFRARRLTSSSNICRHFDRIDQDENQDDDEDEDNRPDDNW